jgi:phosphoglycolate phosphatase-like HAD superfamily hydrolase
VGRETRLSKTEKIRTLLGNIGISSSQAIYVGDLESDILYCADVPIDVIGVGYGYHPATYLAERGATYTVETVQDLSRLLRELTGKGLATAYT